MEWVSGINYEGQIIMVHKDNIEKIRIFIDNDKKRYSITVRTKIDDPCEMVINFDTKEKMIEVLKEINYNVMFAQYLIHRK